MIYRGQFTSIDNIQYTVEFITSTGTNVKEILLSDNPFTVSYEGTDDIFKPLKLSGSTVRCWVDDYMFDLFTGTAKGVKCILYKEESVEWCGYVTPNIYNQNYLQKKFELEVECIDALSILYNIKYTVEDKQPRTFADIINKAVIATGYDFNLFFDDFAEYNLDQLYISDSNWFDEEGESMSYKDILENILQYLNLTMYQWQDNIYIVDYNLIKKKTESFNLDDVKIEQTPTISLTEVYNQISVVCSVYNTSYSPDFTADSKVIEASGINERIKNNY